jgi:outer membrane murein-binding lipoprotein Lpp
MKRRSLAPGLLAAGLLLAGCAVNPEQQAAATQCGPEVERLNEQLAAEVADRQRAARAAARREEALRKQLDAMKSIERGILERQDRVRSESK